MLIWRNEAIRTIYVTPGQDLVTDEARALRKELQGWARHKTERLVLDLARVQAIDPTGLETIIALYDWLRTIGGELIIENASAELKGFFHLMRGEGRLTISGTGWPGSKDTA
ncbi:MAG: STAS domain-containing protein [Syntrophales bacterium]|jgi:anti-anti-sigma factor|nr:STAS domain-containing protein [Syntrophales bacterium]